MTALAVRPATRAAGTAADSWRALGTSVRLVVTDPAQLAEGRALLEAELDLLDRTCSRFRPDSELAALDAAGGRTVQVSSLLAESLAVALRAARLTGGDVDPTVGQAMADAGYNQTFARMERVGPALVLAHHPVPGWRTVELDEEHGTVRTPPGTRLDLGATAKALGADRAAVHLADVLGCGVLVSLGGDIRAAGRAPAGGWQIRVRDRTDDSRTDDDRAQGEGPTQQVSLPAGGLATSSTTVRHWVRGGQLMHHLLDPRSGVPVASPWRTVSVVAASCVDANTASTAGIVRGRPAVDWLAGLGLPARFVDTAGAVTTTDRWPR